jgi:hypothetical protein
MVPAVNAKSRARRAGEAWRASRRLQRELVEQALAAGRDLAALRAGASDAEWEAHLRQAGIRPKQAERLIALAGLGLRAATIVALGGPDAALSFAENAAPVAANLPRCGKPATATELAEMLVAWQLLLRIEAVDPGWTKRALDTFAELRNPRPVESLRRAIMMRVAALERGR